MAHTDFDLFRISEDHEALREAVRAVADAKVAPHAAEVDETASFPKVAYDALRAADFHAPHIPEEYDGVGADALATCIVIEEIARACASTSLIPAVNKLGTMPLLLAGSDELKAKYLPPVARGEAMFSYGLSEREAGSDTASMKTRARRDGDDWILNGQKSWITNAGESQFYTVLAITDPDGRRGANVTAFVVERDDEGFSFGEPERKMGIKGSPTCELHFDDVRIPGDRIIGAPGEGLKIALRTLDHTRVTIGAQAVGIAQGALDFAVGVRQGTQAVRQAHRRLPGHPVHARRHGHDPGGRPADGLRRRSEVRAQRRRPVLLRRRREGLRLRRRDAGHHRRRPAPRRLRLHPRLPRRADDARRQDHPDLRGHQPDPADRHGTPPARPLTRR